MSYKDEARDRLILLLVEQKAQEMRLILLEKLAFNGYARTAILDEIAETEDQIQQYKELYLKLKKEFEEM